MMQMCYVISVKQKRRWSILNASRRCVYMRKTMQICGFNAKDVKVHFMRTSYVQAEIAQSSTGASRQRKT